MKFKRMHTAVILGLCIAAVMGTLITGLGIGAIVSRYSAQPNSDLAFAIPNAFFDVLAIFTGVPGITVVVYGLVGVVLGLAVDRRKFSQLDKVVAILGFPLMVVVIVVVQFFLPTFLLSADSCGQVAERGSCLYDLATYKQDARFCTANTTCVEHAGSFAGYSLEQCSVVTIRTVRAYCRALVFWRADQIDGGGCVQERSITQPCDKYYTGKLDDIRVIITPDEIIDCTKTGDERCNTKFLEQREQEVLR